MLLLFAFLDFIQLSPFVDIYIYISGSDFVKVVQSTLSENIPPFRAKSNLVTPLLSSPCYWGRIYIYIYIMWYIMLNLTGNIGIHRSQVGGILKKSTRASC